MMGVIFEGGGRSACPSLWQGPMRYTGIISKSKKNYFMKIQCYLLLIMIAYCNMRVSCEKSYRFSIQIRFGSSHFPLPSKEKKLNIFFMDFLQLRIVKKIYLYFENLLFCYRSNRIIWIRFLGYQNSKQSHGQFGQVNMEYSKIFHIKLCIYWSAQ